MCGCCCCKWWCKGREPKPPESEEQNNAGFDGPVDSVDESPSTPTPIPIVITSQPMMRQVSEIPPLLRRPSLLQQQQHHRSSSKPADPPLIPPTSDFEKYIRAVRKKLERTVVVSKSSREENEQDNNNGDPKSDIDPGILMSDIIATPTVATDLVFQLKLLLAAQLLTLSPQHRDVIRTKDTLALALTCLGRNGDAVKLYRQVYEFHSQREVDYQLTLETRQRLATALLLEGPDEAAEALEFFQQNFDIQTKTLGPFHPSTLRVQQSIGVALTQLGRFDEALTVLTKVHESQINIFGRWDVATVVTRSSMAKVMKKLGRMEQAIELMGQVFHALGTRMVVGRDERVKIAVQHSLTTWSRELSHSEDLHQMTLEREARVLGVEHPQTLSTLLSLAILYQRQGDFEKADKAFFFVYETFKSTLGDQHPKTIKAKRLRQQFLIDLDLPTGIR